MNNKIFNIVAVLNETFKEIDIDFDDHIEVMNSIGFLHLFDDLKDYRQPGKIQYKLSDILLLCFLSIIYEGKTTCLGIYDHILVYKNRYEKYGLIKDGQIPSHDTIRRTLMCIDPVEFEEITIDASMNFFRTLENVLKVLCTVINPLMEKKHVAVEEVKIQRILKEISMY